MIQAGLFKVKLNHTKTNNSEQNLRSGDICPPRSSVDENCILLGRYPVSTGKQKLTFRKIPEPPSSWSSSLRKLTVLGLLDPDRKAPSSTHKSATIYHFKVHIPLVLTQSVNWQIALFFCTIYDQTRRNISEELTVQFKVYYILHTMYF